MRRAAGTLPRLLALAALALAGCQQSQAPNGAQQALATSAASDVVARGRYLLRAGDCRACHTRQGGEPWAGGRPVPTPFGTVYAPNISPDPATGIGNWSADDFWQALHFGKAPDGSTLYPAFPYPAFTHITRADSDAMFAALQTVEPVTHENREPELSFPFNQRGLLPVWRALYFEPGVYQPDPDKSDAWNRGAYLVKGLGHCAACHSPRNALGATDEDRALGGGMIPVLDWYAPNLHAGPGGGLEGWQRDELVTLLATGQSVHGSAYGPMQEVVVRSLQYLSDEDLEAIATYLLDQPHDLAAPPTKGIQVGGRQAAALVKRGGEIYAEHCADCHGKKGMGRGGVYPQLVGNSSVQGHPVNAIRAVLLGGFAPATKAHPRPYSMPPFAPRFSDQDVAAVVSYIRYQFADGASAVSPQTVKKYRSAPLQ